MGQIAVKEGGLMEGGMRRVRVCVMKLERRLLEAEESSGRGVVRSDFPMLWE